MEGKNKLKKRLSCSVHLKPVAKVSARAEILCRTDSGGEKVRFGPSEDPVIK